MSSVWCFGCCPSIAFRLFCTCAYHDDDDDDDGGNDDGGGDVGDVDDDDDDGGGGGGRRRSIRAVTGGLRLCAPIEYSIIFTSHRLKPGINKKRNCG